MATETVELTGHIVDSLLLAKVLDAIVDAGIHYELTDVQIGRTNTDPSHARITLEGDEDELDRLIDDLQVHGVNRIGLGETRLEQPEVAVHLGGRPLNDCLGPDEGGVGFEAADGKVKHGPLGLSAIQRVGGHLHLAKRVLLHAKALGHRSKLLCRSPRDGG